MFSGDITVLGGNGYEDGDGNHIFYYPVVHDFADYDATLKEIGLHPLSTPSVRLDHSRVRITGAANTNVSANGMYDFILAYYNPRGDGTAIRDERALLPQTTAAWPSGMVFKSAALPTGITSRTIGGATTGSPAIIANNPNRKGADGQPNNNVHCELHHSACERGESGRRSRFAEKAAF